LFTLWEKNTMTDLMIRGLRKEDVVDYSVDSHPMGNGTQVKFAFVNGWGASVVQFSLDSFAGTSMGSYGANEGKWELAVLKGEEINYNNPVSGADGVIGYLDETEVVPLLVQIAALDPVTPKQIEGE